MDLRVLVLSADVPLAGMIRAQVDNLGFGTNTATDYDDAVRSLEWADAVVVDVADGFDDLQRVRSEWPTMRIVAVAPDEEDAARATAAGAYSVLVEPFSISDIVEHIRGLGDGDTVATVDLRGTKVVSAGAAVDDKPWWATR